MTKGIEILNGISEWIRESVGPEAENRGQDATSDSDDGDEAVTEDNGRATSDYDSPACCSAAGNTDLSVLDQ